MRPRFALGLVALGVLGLVLAGNTLERGAASFLGRKLSKKLGAPVQVGGVGLHGLGLAARDVRIDAADRGAALTLDRVAIGWKRVDIQGGTIALDGRFLRASPDPPRARAARGGTFLMGWTFWTGDSVRFEGVSLLLSSGGWKREIGPFHGEIAREDHGERGRVSVKLGEGTVSAEGTFSAAGEGASVLRFESISPEAFLETLPGGIQLDGTLNLSMTRDRALVFSGDLDVRAAGFEWEPLSESPVNAEARVELQGRWDGSTLSVTRGLLRSRRAEIDWSGNLAFAQGKPFADLKLRLRNTPCQNVMDAIPAGVMGEFSGFVLDGTMEGELGLKLAPENPDQTSLDVSIRDGCRFRKGPDAVELARLRRPFTHRVVIPGVNGHSGHNGDQVLSFETGPSSPHWVELPDVSPFFIHAVLAQEDARFFKHAGFLSDAFEAALARNLAEGRFAAGGSTISMQVARNLFLVRDKTLARKVQEVVLTWWLEKSLSKTEILELYLNLIEFGPRVYGIGPASWHYFGRAPDSLSPAEAAFLATVLPSPTRRYRDYQRGELSRWSQMRVEQLLRRMWERGRIDQEALSHGLSEARWLSFTHGNHGTASPPHRRREPFGWAAPLPLS